MNNVIDLGNYLKDKASDANVHVLEHYMPHASQLTLDLNTRLEIIGKLTLNGWMADADLTAFEVHRLVPIAMDMFQGVHFQFQMLTAAVVQQNKEDSTELTLYMYGADVDRFKEAESSGSPLRFNFQVQLSIYTMDGDFSGIQLEDRSKLVVSRDPDSSITINQIKRIMDNMEELVITGGGKTQLTDDGKYVAYIRHSPRHVLMMALVPEISITRNAE